MTPILLDFEVPNDMSALELKFFQPVLLTNKNEIPKLLIEAQQLASQFCFTYYGFKAGMGSIIIPGKITTREEPVYVSDVPQEYRHLRGSELDDAYWNRGGPPQRYAGSRTIVTPAIDTIVTIGAMLYYCKKE